MNVTLTDNALNNELYPSTANDFVYILMPTIVGQNEVSNFSIDFNKAENFKLY